LGLLVNEKSCESRPPPPSRIDNGWMLALGSESRCLEFCNGKPFVKKQRLVHEYYSILVEYVSRRPTITLAYFRSSSPCIKKPKMTLSPFPGLPGGELPSTIL